MLFQFSSAFINNNSNLLQSYYRTIVLQSLSRLSSSIRAFLYFYIFIFLLKKNAVTFFCWCNIVFNWCCLPCSPLLFQKKKIKQDTITSIRWQPWATPGVESSRFILPISDYVPRVIPTNCYRKRWIHKEPTMDLTNHWLRLNLADEAPQAPIARLLQFRYFHCEERFAGVSRMAMTTIRCWTMY